jgi:hypothetical protein
MVMVGYVERSERHTGDGIAWIRSQEISASCGGTTTACPIFYYFGLPDRTTITHAS